MEAPTGAQRRKLAWPPTRCQTESRRPRGPRPGPSLRRHIALALALLAAGGAGGCELFLGPSPALLDYFVSLEDGAVKVSLSVAGGPRPTACVGFGASPLGSGPPVRIDDVEARMASGAPLNVRRIGDASYRVDVSTDEPWTLDYRVYVGSPAADVYHRSSSASPDHILLLGVDVWARLFDLPSAIDLPPRDRPLGEVAEATVRFDDAGFPRGWRVVSASPETALNRFDLLDHPARSAFALGPYRVEVVDKDAGVRAAIHSGWDVARSRLLNYSRQLVRVQSRDFGPPPGDPTLMIFTPLPKRVRPMQGARTAGMVWDRTLVLFAGASPSVPRDGTKVRELLAVFLGHELFHLYVPWGLPVTQPLSWLSEGWSEHVGRRSAVAAGILSRGGADASLRDAYTRYGEMGGASAGSLQNASEAGGELRDLLYMRGELVFRILDLEWSASGKPGSFNAAFWQRLQTEFDGQSPLEPEAVSRVLRTMVSPTTVRRLVDGAAMITLPELKLGRR